MVVETPTLRLSLRALDLRALVDIVGRRADGQVNECPVFVEVDRFTTLDRVQCHSRRVEIEEQPRRTSTASQHSSTRAARNTHCRDRGHACSSLASPPILDRVVTD